MITALEIDGCKFLIDKDKTQQFYLTQEKITDDCQCEDCNFYSEIFTKEPIEIFSILSSFGVDLQKNLTSEPTGVWCVRDNDVFLHSDQLYQAFGKMSHCQSSGFSYDKHEHGYRVRAHFVQVQSDTINITLYIDKV